MSFNVNHTEFPLKMYHPTPGALIGWGAYRMAGEEAKKLGIKHALIVTSGLRGTGIIDEITGVLKHVGIEVTVYDGVTSNPKDHEVHAAHKLYKQAQCDGIISVGGGSSHDCAKAVRIVEAHDGQSIREFNGMNTCQKPILIPQLAITTTAGTGSETSWASVITDTEKLYKMVIFDPTIITSRAIVDPALMRTMPPKLTAWTGMDALTHAVEAYVSRLGVITSQGLAIHAIKLINEGLRQAYANPDNAEAREKQAWAQYTAGMAFNSAGLGITHSIAHCLGALFDSPHGQCNAIAMVPVARYNMVACPERYADIARAMGVDTTGMTVMQAAESAVEALDTLRKEIGITENFSSLGLQEHHLPRFSEVVFNDVCTGGNPRIVTTDAIQQIFRECMDPAVEVEAEVLA
ncbi:MULTISPECIES: iron-containing alcohol dehydrogenase family protein [Aneurinibacillus]|jgi:alcohol dehydrogenase class IV|uniref:NDMA-dependent methanol dehydrogenase n=1 Tax=Aneurinibacillus danicus TaxID=267746 RepID=A0A511V432_9BACL|nr:MULTISPECIES: iron-containing alcohol dehydrogenase family protein [Aneurinibacillus]GEN33549.1 NDMA-dependent methanol dehydrogenase [Aneurinibacillus danicus]